MEVFADPAELFVPEGILHFARGDEVAVGVGEALACHYEAEAVFLEAFLNLRQEVFGVERHFGQQYDVRGVLGLVAALCDARARRYPPGVPAHHFDNGYEVVVAHGLVVEGELPDGGGKVFNDAAVSGAVVGDGEVVVNRLCDSYDSHFIALGRGVVGYFVGGVLRIIAAYIKEEAYVVRLEHLYYAREILFAPELVTAGAEGGPGRVAQAAHRLLGFVGEVDELFVQNALHSVEGAVNFLYAVVVEGFRYYAREARIYDGRGAAGLRYQNVSSQLFFHNIVFI